MDDNTIPPLDSPGSDGQGLFTNLGAKLLRSVISTIIFAGGVLIAAALLNTFVFQSYYVQGRSMSPTLENNDRLIVSKIDRTASSLSRQSYIPSRGQVIILGHAVSILTNAKEEELIKRVIGLPGERIHIEGGRVTVFNNEYPEGFDVDKALKINLEPTFSERPIGRYTVPADHVFVLGDNRGPGGSYDSRSFGSVSSDKVVGRLWLRILPLNQSSVF